MQRGPRRQERGEGMLRVVIGLAVLVVLVISGIKIVPIHIRGSEMFDAMDEAANFGGLKEPEKLEYDIFSRAEEVRAPVKMENISVVRNGGYIIVAVKYQESVDVFGYRYVYNFDKKIEKLVF
jgi:hypothetical protein